MPVKTKMFDTNVVVHYNCGCGLRVDNYDAAYVHVKSTGHSLTVYGSLTAVKVPMR